MKQLFIVLTHTGTILSKIIKIYTKDEFSHVSISLDRELNEMYSFGRLNPYNPFLGGFVHESIKTGTFKRFKKTTANIYSLLVTDKQYEDAKNIIKYIQENKNLHSFNVIGLFAVGFNKRLQSNNSFYCAEFVQYVINNSKIANNLPEIIKPEDFKNLENLRLIYHGKLRDYNVEKVSIQEKLLELMKKEATI